MLSNDPGDDRLIIYIDTKKPNDAKLTLAFAKAVADELEVLVGKEFELVGIRPGSLTVEYLTLGAAVAGVVGASLGLAAAALTLAEKIKTPGNVVSETGTELMDKTEAQRLELTVGVEVIVIHRHEMAAPPKRVEGVDISTIAEEKDGRLSTKDQVEKRWAGQLSSGRIQIDWETDFIERAPTSMRIPPIAFTGKYAVENGLQGIETAGGFALFRLLKGTLPLKPGQRIRVLATGEEVSDRTTHSEIFPRIIEVWNPKTQSYGGGHRSTAEEPIKIGTDETREALEKSEIDERWRMQLAGTGQISIHPEIDFAVSTSEVDVYLDEYVVTGWFEILNGVAGVKSNRGFFPFYELKTPLPLAVGTHIWVRGNRGTYGQGSNHQSVFLPNLIL